MPALSASTSRASSRTRYALRPRPTRSSTTPISPRCSSGWGTRTSRPRACTITARCASRTARRSRWSTSIAKLRRCKFSDRVGRRTRQNRHIRNLVYPHKSLILKGNSCIMKAMINLCRRPRMKRKSGVMKRARIRKNRAVDGACATLSAFSLLRA